MKQFVFSLQKILELREFEQKQAEAELGKANAEIARINNKLEELARSKIESDKTTEGQFDLNILYAAQNYRAYVENQKEILLEELTNAKMIADEKKAVLAEAMKKVDVLEKLKEKKYSQWKKEAEKEYEAEVEDIVSARYFKNMSGS